MFTLYKIKLETSVTRERAQRFLLEHLSQFCKMEITRADLLYGADGKPYLTPSIRPKLCFNLSHSENFLALVCSNRYDVGLDIQVHRKFNPKVLDRICAPEELAHISRIDSEIFFKIWTIKEAALKCLGTGFRFPANKLVIDFKKNEVKLLENPSMENFIFARKISRLRFKKLDLFDETTSYLAWNLI